CHLDDRDRRGDRDQQPVAACAGGGLDGMERTGFSPREYRPMRRATGTRSGAARNEPARVLQLFRLDGAEGQNRTADTTIFSRMLYQLSYLGTRGGGRNAPEPGDYTTGKAARLHGDEVKAGAEATGPPGVAKAGAE